MRNKILKIVFCSIGVGVFWWFFAVFLLAIGFHGGCLEIKSYPAKEKQIITELGNGRIMVRVEYEEIPNATPTIRFADFSPTCKWDRGEKDFWAKFFLYDYN